MKIFILIYSTHFLNVSCKTIFILFLGEISRENPFNATDIKKKHPPIITTCYLYKQVFLINLVSQLYRLLSGQP